jgi:aerobic-type carbon monoxide dehydrogenase small subunit (CoxS/CutS family)
MAEVHKLSITVNGEKFEHWVPARLLLSDFLRETVGLTGTHLGCEQGVCGSCTVLLGREAIRSCLMFAVQADGAEVTTIEGLGEPSQPNAVQRAMHDAHALQCGFCTAGIVVGLTGLLNNSAHPSNEEVLDTLGGHLCRCTGYVNIRKAAAAAVASYAAEEE